MGDSLPSNENKMGDGGRGRASLGVKVWKSSQKWSARRSAVRSIAWLGSSSLEPLSVFVLARLQLGKKVWRKVGQLRI
jgi:hypothetical protein